MIFLRHFIQDEGLQNDSSLVKKTSIGSVIFTEKEAETI